MTETVTFSIYPFKDRLSEPYRLPFGDVTDFEGFYILAQSEGRQGYGEITPLPGYGHETVASVQGALEALREKSADRDAWEEIQSLAIDFPFAASGVATALETAGAEWAGIWEKLTHPVPMLGLCQGDDDRAMVRSAGSLVTQGYDVLKIKVGRLDPDAELKRLKAVAEVLPVGGKLRLDANQTLTESAALAICEAIEVTGLPIELLEQPFGIDDWDAHERLIAAIGVPIMLDESISDGDDIKRAAAIGAKYVKLKLCKHAGLKATLTLLEAARQEGLGVVFGNGVQTALGNHLECAIHLKAGLVTASEANGFLKTDHPTIKHGMEVSSGLLNDGGFNALSAAFEEMTPAFEFALSC